MSNGDDNKSKCVGCQNNWPFTKSRSRMRGTYYLSHTVLGGELYEVIPCTKDRYE